MRAVRRRPGPGTCTYCRGAFAPDEARFTCGCGASLHTDCHEANGRCTTLGCAEPGVVVGPGSLLPAGAAAPAGSDGSARETPLADAASGQSSARELTGYPSLHLSGLRGNLAASIGAAVLLLGGGFPLVALAEGEGLSPLGHAATWACLAIQLCLGAWLIARGLRGRWRDRALAGRLGLSLGSLQDLPWEPDGVRARNLGWGPGCLLLCALLATGAGVPLTLADLSEGRPRTLLERHLGRSAEDVRAEREAAARSRVLTGAALLALWMCAGAVWLRTPARGRARFEAPLTLGEEARVELELPADLRTASRLRCTLRCLEQEGIPTGDGVAERITARWTSAQELSPQADGPATVVFSLPEGPPSSDVANLGRGPAIGRRLILWELEVADVQQADTWGLLFPLPVFARERAPTSGA